MPAAATLDKNGQPKRKRNRRRKRRLSLSSSSSSSSSESEVENPPSVAPIVNGAASAQESSSSEESSSDSSSESDVDPTPANFDIPAVSTSAASVLTPFVQPELSNRQRSPSPPYFGFPDFQTQKRKKPILWGELEEDRTAEVTDDMRKAWDEEQATLRKHYLEVVVNKFGKELDDMRKEPGVSDRLGMLISSLSQGASLMETAAIAEEQQKKDKSIWAREGTEVLPAQVGVEALKKQSTATEQKEDIEMAS